MDVAAIRDSTVFFVAVRSSDKRIARDEDLSDSEDEGDGRKNASSSKEDGPLKKRPKTTTPVPKPPVEDKTEKKSDEKVNDKEPEKEEEVEKMENGIENTPSTENETKQPPRYVLGFAFMH